GGTGCSDIIIKNASMDSMLFLPFEIFRSPTYERYRRPEHKQKMSKSLGAGTTRCSLTGSKSSKSRAEIRGNSDILQLAAEKTPCNQRHDRERNEHALRRRWCGAAGEVAL